MYDVVTSAENGNGLGILAGALEAAAAGAAGIGMLPGQASQTLSYVATALGAASVATNMAGDFASGNLAQGLIDSLNLYLPAEALAQSSYQSNLNMNSAAFAAAGVDPAPNVGIPDFGGIVAAAEYSPRSASASAGSIGVSATVTSVTPGSLISVGAAAPGEGGNVVTQSGTTYAVSVASAIPDDESSTTAPDIILVSSSITQNVLQFLAYPAADGMASAAISARNMSATQAFFVDNNGNQLFNQSGQPMMMSEQANPSAAPDFGAALMSTKSDETGALVANELLAAFRQGGAWDFQRVGPNPNPQFVGAFTDYANVEIGAYAAAIGVSMNYILGVANTYAAANSNFVPTSGPPPTMDPTYANLPESKVWDITHGYQWYNSGLIGHH